MSAMAKMAKADKAARRSEQELAARTRAKTRRKIVLPYRPTNLWRKVIHPNLEMHRFSVVVAHRRFGKTVGTINHVIKMCIKNRQRSPQYAYIAPFRNQAQHIAWNYLKYFTHVIPNMKVNESELYVEFPSRFAGASGGRIYIMGADHPDALRGSYWDGVILDEYAQMKPELWNEVIRPALADRDGWAVFIGTPKGQNAFYDVYQRAQRERTWYACMYRADESGLFDEGGRYGPKELAALKKDMSEDAVRQELYCDFTASAYNVLITIDLVTAACKKAYTAQDVAGAPKVLGVDVARFGNDRSVFVRRQGLAAMKPTVFRDIDNMELAAQLMREIEAWRPDAVFVDAGRGEGVIDRCRQMGYQVTEVPFGGKPVKTQRYLNKRAEMWGAMKEWLEAGGSLPDVPELKSELVTPEYSFDAANRMRLESKEHIKERLGKSPDLADALALTFALPVVPKAALERNAMCETDYELFE